MLAKWPRPLPLRWRRWRAALGVSRISMLRRFVFAAVIDRGERHTRRAMSPVAVRLGLGGVDPWGHGLGPPPIAYKAPPKNISDQKSLRAAPPSASHRKGPPSRLPHTRDHATGLQSGRGEQGPHLFPARLVRLVHKLPIGPARSSHGTLCYHMLLDDLRQDLAAARCASS